MASPFPFEPMLVFGWLASMLLIGVLLRARMPFFQRFLFPGCLIGGIASLILINTHIINIAAMGYFFAFFVRVPLVNRGIRKGLAAHGEKDLPAIF
jgi:ESS family glutamate:Na+ symporter